MVIITRQHAAADKNDVRTDLNGDPNSSLDTQTITIRLQDLLESGNPVYNISSLRRRHGERSSRRHCVRDGRGHSAAGGYVLQSHGEQITVLKAVALAHGLTGFAKADQAVIMRNNTATGTKGHDTGAY